MSFAAKSRYKTTLQIPKKLLNFNKLLKKKTLLTKRIFKNSAIRFLNLKKKTGENKKTKKDKEQIK